MKTIRVADMKYIGNIKIKGGFLIVKPKETYELDLIEIKIKKSFLGIKYNWYDNEFKWIKQKNNEKRNNNTTKQYRLYKIDNRE